MASSRVANYWKRSRSSLTFRFSVIVGIALLIFSLISGYASSVFERRSLRAGLEGQAQRLAQAFGSSVANALFTFNSEAIKAAAQGFGNDPAVRFLEVKEPSGKVIASAGDPQKTEGLVSASYKVKMGNEVVGTVALGMSTESIDQAMVEVMRVLVAREVVVLVLLFSLVAYLVRREVTRPLAELDGVMEKAQKTGDLTVRLQVKRGDEIGNLTERFNAFMETLQGLLVEVSGTAHRVSSAAQHLTSASHQLSSGAQEQASSLEETAASLEEITGTVKQNADNAKQANQLAMGSRDVAERGGQVVETAVTAMGEINKSSKKIADIITTIDEIAFQTNLLALNAAVEAARAGEQGRGFAVVASEVRNLAQRSATAAKEIKALIQDSVAKVESGSDLVTKSGQTLGEIVSSVKRVTDIIGEIAAASQEQSTGIDQVNRAVTQMDAVVQSNAAQTEEMSSTAQSLTTQARQLQGLVAKFKLGSELERAAMIEERVAVRPKAAAEPEAHAPRAPRIAEHPPINGMRGNGLAAHHAEAFEEF
ncbi:MAG TPA: methyl-accepting chemotaxis protein [Candidatus Binatia bacterium]|jgi:methyl-accepting chemotaxis protein